MAILAVIMTFWSPMRPIRSVPRSPVRFVLNLPLQHELLEGVALSPDSRNLVYGAAKRGGNFQLFLRPLDQFTATPIAGTDDGRSPFFSPDGKWIGFFAEGKLKKVTLTGGAPVTICDATAVSASWGPDDKIIFSGYSNRGLQQVSASGGRPEVIARPDVEKGETWYLFPEILPDGEAVIFTITTKNIVSQDYALIAVRSLKTGEQRILVEGGTRPRYASSGHLVFYRAGKLMAVPFESKRLQINGSPVHVVDSVLGRDSNEFQGALSADGSLIFVPGDAESDRTLVWVDRQGAEQPLARNPSGFFETRYSPDGQRLAVNIGQTNHQLWIYDIARGSMTRFNFEADNHRPVWTPDGKRVTFASNRNGPENIFWKPADGGGDAEQLLRGEHRQRPNSWSPDGRFLVYVESHPTTQDDLWILNMDGKPLSRPFLQTEFNELSAEFSPDGRWIAYQSDESGRYEIYVRPFPGPGGKWQISTEGGARSVWSSDGRELFYRDRDKMMAVAIESKPAFKVGKPRLLFDGPYEPEYDVAPDGEKFVMIKVGEKESMPRQLNVVLNWFEELKRLVPTKN